MPLNDKTIRIIKRDQRKSLAGQQEIIAGGSKTENQTRREISETVTSWIEEQKERKKGAFKPSLP